jgi:hypothetical protein
MTKVDTFEMLGTERRGFTLGDSGQGGCIDEYEAAYKARSVEADVALMRT